MSLLDILSLQSENSPLSANCRTRQCSNEATLEWENHVFSVILHCSPQECCLFAHRLLLRGRNDDILCVLWAGVTSLTMWQPPPWKPQPCCAPVNYIKFIMVYVLVFTVIPVLVNIISWIERLCTQQWMSALCLHHNIFSFLFTHLAAQQRHTFNTLNKKQCISGYTLVFFCIYTVSAHCSLFFVLHFSS